MSLEARYRRGDLAPEQAQAFEDICTSLWRIDRS
jgi:hypothetical protein